MVEDKQRLLLIEDNPVDAELLLVELKRAGFDFLTKRVETRGDIENALKNESYDLIISDYSLPGYNGRAALNYLKYLGLDTPFIMISGAIGEDTAVDIFRDGASDYLLKSSLTRLPAVIERALREAEAHREKKRADLLERILFQVSQAANRASSLVGFFGEIHAAIQQIMHAENFYIALVDTQQNLLTFPYFVDKFDPVPQPIRPRRGMTEYVLRTGEPVLVTPEKFAELHQQGEVDSIGTPSLDWVGVPLKADGKTVGVMVIQTYDEGIRYTDKDLQVLEFIVDQVELVIQRKFALDQMRESEAKFSLFMENLPLQGYITDPDGRLLYANREYKTLAGREDVVGRTYFELFPPEVAKMMAADDQSALNDGVVQRTVPMELPSGQRTFETIKFPIPSSDGANLIGGIIWDITGRIQAENLARQAAEELARAYDATLEGWSHALEIREKETAGHSQRVVEMTMRLARSMGVSEEALVHVRRGAILHDIGKMGIPDSILLKPGPLTAEEWLIMRQHPLYAYELLAPIKFLAPALDIPYTHHERWNGTGYPRGLKGKEIPMAGRIFAVLDVWDALNSERPYRPAWPIQAVREFIIQEAGRLFDPDVVRAFLKLLDEPGWAELTQKGK